MKSLVVANHMCPGLHMHVEVCEGLRSLFNGTCLYMIISCLHGIHSALVPRASSGSLHHHHHNIPPPPPRMCHRVTLGSILELLFNSSLFLPRHPRLAWHPRCPCAPGFSWKLAQPEPCYPTSLSLMDFWQHLQALAPHSKCLSRCPRY